MKEVKNAFIKSKMNKDLDSRLIPSGEYRHAQNSQVSKSEGSDVGALENILGNKEIANLTNGVSGVKSIGFLADEFSGNVYVFLTDNNTANYFASGPGSNHFIYKYNTDNPNNTPVKLVEGAFLNFSTLNPIYGVNLLEDLLFFTDNRNQPRKINVRKAERTPGYYNKEDHISVAKYYPYQAINLYKESVVDTGEYESTMKDVVSKNLPNGGSATISAAVVDSNTFAISNLNIEKYPNEPINGLTVGYIDANGDIQDFQDLGITVSSYTSPNITLSGNVNIPLIGSATELVFSINPYYVNNYPGDDSFLEDKFVRFSYRFKFYDGEYSLIAPFTQPCFIPKQDGYFLNTELNKGDQNETIDSSIVSFMENKVNKIDLQIPLPCNIDDLDTEFHISEIDIIYKESDGLSLQVVETIEVSNIQGSDPIYEYSYTSQKPYKTLPSDEITRVYDKVPIKALSQEVISNRIVYGNYQTKNTPPAFLNYNVASTEKSNFALSTEYPVVKDYTSIIEYPNSSLKTNRSYQVGVVLADRFGRQSTVILSNNKEIKTINGVSYSGSTLYSPYINEGTDEDNWLGNSLKILFNDPISGDLYNGDSTSVDYNPMGWYTYKVVVKQNEQDYYNVYTAGALKSLPSNTNSNVNISFIPLSNDNINKVPRDLSEVGPTQKQFRSSIRLFGRVENNDIQYSNTGNKQYYPGKKSFNVSTIQDIFDIFDFDDTSQVSSNDNINVVYKAETNPLVAQINTSQTSYNQFGVINNQTTTFNPINNLAIFETKPDISRLDIYWETSTSGLIKDLNTAIIESENAAAAFSSFNTNDFNEGITVNEDILSSTFTLVDSFGSNIPINEIQSLSLDSVVNTETSPQTVSDYFTLYEPTPGSKFWNIKVTQKFIDNIYFGPIAGERVWNFYFTAVVNNVSTQFHEVVELKNLFPVITPSDNFTVHKNQTDTLIASFTAVNGADSSNPQRGKDIEWNIVSQVNGDSQSGNYFSLSSSDTPILSSCNLNNAMVNTLPPDQYTVVVRATDAGQAYDEVTVTVSTSIVVDAVREYEVQYELYPGDGPETFNFVVLQIDNPPAGFSSGYYTWMENGQNGGTWNDLVNFSGGGTTITVDATNSSTVDPQDPQQYVCPSGSQGWLYDDNLTSALNHAKTCLVGTFFSVGHSVQIIDSTGYVFQVV